MLRKVDPSSSFCNKLFQLATLKVVAWQVEHAVVIRATTSLTCTEFNNVARHVELKCCPYSCVAFGENESAPHLLKSCSF